MMIDNKELCRVMNHLLCNTTGHAPVEMVTYEKKNGSEYVVVQVRRNKVDSNAYYVPIDGLTPLGAAQRLIAFVEDRI